ncbi:transcription termination factor Rho [Microlunatus elymi]|uniref:Transcription termination factor Rho n=1 Tax=Microlunatus elymi TaxID=2596828 RepID=A0A516Q0V4_9ACTN|nr:transcription termination factor Rho [Microlunatus elymi]QDP97064.1 transcription termination factor Rho [Microlunatus elymi]
MTDTAEATGTQQASRKRKGTGLESLVLPELKQIASQLGLKGAGGMRKGQLIEAIKSAQSGGTGASAAPSAATRPSSDRANADRSRKTSPAAAESPAGQPTLPDTDRTTSRTDRAESSPEAGSRRETESRPERADGGRAEKTPDSRAEATRAEQTQASRAELEQAIREQVSRDSRDTERRQSGRDNRGDQTQREPSRDNNRDNSRDGNRDGRDQQNREGRDQGNRQRNNRGDNRNDNRSDNRNDNRGDDDGSGGRRSRRRRSRDRQGRRNNRGGGGIERYESEPVISEDDVLVPTSGILDVLDNYAFVRTSGYLPGSNDAYVSLSMVKKYGLRKGDVITGAIRQPTDGERREKFNPLVKIDTVNNADPEAAKGRADFNKLTPLYPNERYRLETTPNNLTGRLIDLVAPIGKGQRGLIVAPAKAGKTMVMQAIANAITTNSPNTHLMVVLVDERPEEVTDFERSVRGEVISSTFDRPADDHTTVAELAIERAKRLVELGHDVVVLLDGITRLGRAYNLAAPASGRILSGGVDSAALYPPKKFFGAARNIENGGSLTILATALIESGSKMDEVIFEEFKGTGNMELRLRREYSEKRIFPAIDVDASSTRREELLMGREELGIIWKLRRVLSNLDGQQALEMMLDRLKKTQTNSEFLVAITKTMPGQRD